MQLGIQTRGDYEHVLRVARWAEGRDLSAFAVPDHYLQRGDDPQKPAWDHLVHLAAVAVETTSIRLVSLVSPVTFRHPAVLYKMGVTLDEISGGRFTLGLGAGWMEQEFSLFGLPFPDTPTRMEMLEEAMAYLRTALTPGGGGFTGRHYTIADFDPEPRPIDLRLMAGGAGNARARRITARYADEYNLYACPPARYAEIVEKTSALAVEAGRRPEDVFWSSAGPALAAKKEPDYRRILARLAEVTRQTTERIEEVYEERQYPHGSGSKPAEMVAALAEAGCRLYYPQIIGQDLKDFDVIIDAYQG
ncbi:MAG: LLM class flavin-dependent oxidoreductase [Actinobacteria bacterium]|nr:LLM class flavin-dependent oxidoreductase [Actinomycetota bacterium]